MAYSLIELIIVIIFHMKTKQYLQSISSNSLMMNGKDIPGIEIYMNRLRHDDYIHLFQSPGHRILAVDPDAD